ncbi:MAG: hypothetical protein HY824_11395 [Acidobacteria bacterium]|nr:hypothetical protein [Acidobacteriota bacterium]
MSSAAEARFRVPTPAAVARVVTVIALDPSCDAIVARLAEGSWRGVTFFPASAATDRGGRLIDDIAEGDLAVMVAAAGSDAAAAARIGRACSDRRVHTATFVVRTASATDEQVSKTLAQVRPWSLMVVIVSDDHYVEDILRSFR